MKIRVLGARLLVKEEKNDTTTKSGIVIPGADREPTFRGEVIQAGPGARFEDGTLCPMSVKVGDVVMYNNFAGHPVEINGEIFIILNEGDIIGIIEQDE